MLKDEQKMKWMNEHKVRFYRNKNTYEDMEKKCTTVKDIKETITQNEGF